MNLSDFFFLRPYWLLLLIPAVALMILAIKRPVSNGNEWQHLVDPHLLKHLGISGAGNSSSRWLIPLLVTGYIAGILAMSGPTWQKIELPAFKASEPTVIVMSLAQSMNATDLKPSRIKRASHKVRDILDKTKGGDTGLVIYSDLPFTAVPLTSDGQVIEEVLPELSTKLMPVLGNRLDLAISKASDLLQQAGAHSGKIIVLADNAGSNEKLSNDAAKAAKSKNYTVNVLGIGTEAGARLQTAEGKAIRTQDGQDVNTALNETALRKLAAIGGGVFTKLTADNSDVESLLPVRIDTKATSGQISNLHADSWNDMGFWLLLIPVLLAPLAFRRGVLMALPILFAISAVGTPQPAEAADWNSLWKTPDQQAAAKFHNGDFANAAAGFEDSNWKAASLYKDGKYKQAAEAYKHAPSADANFNKANALAKSGDLQGALDSYDAALKAKPDDSAAKFNRDLVAKLLEQQKKKEQQKKDQQKDKKQDKQKQGQQKQDQQKNQDQKQKSGDQAKDQKKDQSGKGGQQKPDDKGQQSKQSGKSGQSDPPDKSGAQQDKGAQSADKGQSKDQQKSDDKSGQSQSGQPKSDQPKSGEQKSEDTKQAGDRQDNAEQKAGVKKDPQAASGQQAQDNAQSQKSAFQKAMDSLLQGNGGPQKPSKESAQQASAQGQGISEKQQAVEQQLRSVPDDPAGLLKARIRQHYTNLYAQSRS